MENPRIVLLPAAIRLKPNVLLDCPPEIREEIFKHLSLDDQESLACTNQHVNAMLSPRLARWQAYRQSCRDSIRSFASPINDTRYRVSHELFRRTYNTLHLTEKYGDFQPLPHEYLSFRSLRSMEIEDWLQPVEKVMLAAHLPEDNEVDEDEDDDLRGYETAGQMFLRERHGLERIISNSAPPYFSEAFSRSRSLIHVISAICIDLGLVESDVVPQRRCRRLCFDREQGRYCYVAELFYGRDLSYFWCLQDNHCCIVSSRERIFHPDWTRANEDLFDKDGEFIPDFCEWVDNFETTNMELFCASLWLRWVCTWLVKLDGQNSNNRDVEKLAGFVEDILRDNFSNSVVRTQRHVITAMCWKARCDGGEHYIDFFGE